MLTPLGFSLVCNGAGFSLRGAGAVYKHIMGSFNALQEKGNMENTESVCECEYMPRERERERMNLCVSGYLCEYMHPYV